MPVVLFDPGLDINIVKLKKILKRKIDVYITNKKENLNKVIDTIRSNDKISFSDYVYSTSIKNNIKNLINERANKVTYLVEAVSWSLYNR